jgi:hypothetical protein
MDASRAREDDRGRRALPGSILLLLAALIAPRSQHTRTIVEVASGAAPRS